MAVVCEGCAPKYSALEWLVTLRGACVCVCVCLSVSPSVRVSVRVRQSAERSFMIELYLFCNICSLLILSFKVADANSADFQNSAIYHENLMLLSMGKALGLLNMYHCTGMIIHMKTSRPEKVKFKKT